MRSLSALAVSSLLLTTVLTGCHVTSHKDGKNDNVDIGTPFGSMQVKTNDNVDAAGLGITPYPGATVVKKDKDSGAADVNMSFGSFHLGVKAVSLTTPDDSDKVLAFYRKDLSRYGEVLHCDGKKTVGEPTRTAEGLTCDFNEKGNGHMNWSTDGDDGTELRAGSKSRQHIVSVSSSNGGTKIGLVSLDLPTNLSSGNHKDSE